MATNLGLEASIYDNSAKQNIAWFNCLANKHAVPVSASKNKSLGEKILKSFYESWENYGMPTPNLGLWRSAREPEVWEMWLFTVKLHQYAIKVTENFTMSSLKIPVLKNIPRLHVKIFYSSKEVFTCEFATSAVSLVGFKASWNLFLLEWKCGFRKGVSLKEQDVVTHRLYPTRACPAGNYDIFLPSRAQRWTANNFFFFWQKAFVFYDVKRVLWDRIMAIIASLSTIC